MDNIIIGKHTLESLTSGMYSDPFVIYREYIQNCVDSIDEAISRGVIIKGEEDISISIFPTEGRVTIRDNGIGVQEKDVERVLISLGNSQKKSKSARGFRGIGRLAGLSYCQKLIFRTSYCGESISSAIEIDAHKLSKLLADTYEADQTVVEVLSSVYSVDHEPEKKDAHYFEVELIGIDSNSNLLEYENVKNYLEQSLPVPFSSDFVWGKEILNRLSLENVPVDCYNVSLRHGLHTITICKPYQDSFLVDKGRQLYDQIKDIDIISIKSPDGKISASGWIAKTNYLGSIADKRVKGIRLRKGNIQIGDYQTLNVVFKDARFNGWTIGEIHVLDDNMIPNARRDNFEKNGAYFILFEQIAHLAASLTKEIRTASLRRNSEVAKALEQSGKASKKANKALKTVVSNKQITELTKELESAQDALKKVSVKNDSDKYNCNIAFEELDMLIGKLKGATRYKALNSIKNLTIAEKRLLERVFDIIYENQTDNADKLVDSILYSIAEE